MVFFTAQGKVGQDQTPLRLRRNLKFWGWSVHAYVINWSGRLQYRLDALQTRSSA